MSPRDRVAGQLVVEVVRNSEGTDWDSAVDEWQVESMEVQTSSSGVCVCGKTGLRYCYVIVNTVNDSRLHPIGSECINHFGNPTMNNEAEFLRRLSDLRALPQWNLTFYRVKDEKILSRKFIEALHSRDFFTPNRYNGGNGSKDFHFYLKMFNARGMSPKQEVKADLITQNLWTEARSRLS